MVRNQNRQKNNFLFNSLCRKMKKTCCFILLCMSFAICAVFDGNTSVSAAAKSVGHERKTLRVGYYEEKNFQEGAAEGEKKSGYAYEYMRRLEAYTDWEYEYVYGSLDDVYQLLVEGKIDLLAGIRYSDEVAEYVCFPELAMGEVNSGNDFVYIVVSKSRTDLLNELNMAQRNMMKASPNLQSELSYKWFRYNYDNKSLTDSERHWFEKHKKLVVGYYDKFLPYSNKAEDGEAEGVLIDILPELMKGLGHEDFEIEYVSFEEYTDMLNALERNEIDTCFPYNADYWLSEGSSFLPTRDLFDAYFDLVYKGNIPKIEDATIAMVKSNQLIQDYGKTVYQPKEWVLYDTIYECLDAVEKGEVDATITSGLRTSFLLRLKNSYRDLTTFHISVEAPIGFGVNLSDSAMLDVLNHGIRKMSPGFALSNTYKYNQEKSVTLEDFVRNNFGVVMGLMLLFFGTIFLFLHVELVRSKKIARLEREKNESAAVQEAMEHSLDEANYRAEHDELTGVLNRTGFVRLEKHFAKNSRSMGLVVMDVDLFKKVNDEYGHDVGDSVLQHVAYLLMRNFREEDYVVRYGGDEFVIFVAHCDANNVENIIDKVDRINFQLANPTIAYMPPVSLSAGVTIFKGPYSEEVFKEADMALYEKKTKGRGGCLLYREEMKSVNNSAS